MSWCGGGLIIVMPGCPRRRLAISSVTFAPGSWPPSPGFEPWAILISSCSARARYAAVTPNRAEATCLTAESRRSPFGPGTYHAGSSPPSPVFDEPPSIRMPIESAWCASGLSEPRLIALETKRAAMDSAGSTRLSGTGADAPRIRSRSRTASGDARSTARR